MANRIQNELKESLTQRSKVANWIDKRLPVISSLENTLLKHPYPKNLSYMWNFGSIAGIALVIQILTGLFLAMHYVPNADMAFDSVEHIMRDVRYGWLIRYIHAVALQCFLLLFLSILGVDFFTDHIKLLENYYGGLVY